MQVRIPSSAPRKQPLVFCKLLRRVRSVARSGFDFEGDFIKPGSLVDEVTLSGYPGVVMLECAGVSKAGHGHNRSELLYILWQYRSGEWCELGRVTSANWDWAVDLAPIAHRAMGERVVDLAATADKIARYISLEMDRVPESDRARVAAIAHDALAAELGTHVPLGHNNGLSSPLSVPALSPI